VALFLGIAHIMLNYMVDGAFTYDPFIRAFIFLFIAYIVGAIAEKKDSLYDVLKRSDEKLRQVYDSLEQRVKERTAELSHANETLRSEISERERAEKAARESEVKFRILTESSPAAILLYRDDRLIYVNRTAENITGFTREELLSGMPWKFVHPDSRPTVIERAAARLRGDIMPSRYEVKILTKGGEERWLDISAERISYGGAPTGLVSGIDITVRKKTEKALIKSRAILSRAQSIAHVGNWAWDLKTNEMQWSDEIFRIFGYEPKQLHPTYLWTIAHVHPDDRKLVSDSADAAIKENRLFNIDYRIIIADGSTCYINCVADKLRRDADGHPLWMYGIMQDITARKRVEEALQEAKAQAELYLDLMGHDINNMNQIGIGFLELALDTLKLDDRAKQMISKPLEALENSTRLISNVRKLQRAKDGGLLLHEMDVGETIGRLIPQYSRVAGRSVNINYHADRECHVLANDLLLDVFSNIIGNAVKHSRGPLTIDIRLKNALMGDRQHCIVSIEDNGPGISDDMKGQLFTGHQRGKVITGNGLGLYLVKTLVEDFHGTVGVEDRIAGDPSKGCRFIVTLPELV
jgi:PAS domain S-box-containing protein